jgi:glycosyltransferase involved in cell wall biosynthesis
MNGQALSLHGHRDATDLVVLHVQKVAGISGSEAHLLQLLPDLKQRGWDIRFLMLHEQEPGAWEFARELESGGVPVDGIAMHADVDPGTFLRVLDYLVRERPTILHTHLVHADAYGQTTGMLAGIPVRLSTKHGFNEFREGRLFALGDRTLGALAHRQIAISRGLARYLADTEGFAEPAFEIVHYGIGAGSEPQPYAGVEPRFLCVGRLIPIKGHVVLLRAFRQLLDRRPDARLDIAGRGQLEHGLKDLARELDLLGAVRFLGHVTPIQRAIESSFAVVVPSLGEGFGMVALEAMERARPVIAAAIGGLEDLVRENETGLLVPAGESQPLGEAMLALAADPAHAAAMGLEARRRALERFPEDRCTERTEEVYRFWLEERGNGALDAARAALPAPPPV